MAVTNSKSSSFTARQIATSVSRGGGQSIYGEGTALLTNAGATQGESKILLFVLFHNKLSFVVITPVD